MTMLKNASLFALLTIFVGIVPLIMSLVYLVRPNERNLALMRPLSLAGIFAAIAGSVLGFMNVLFFVWTRELNVETHRVMAVVRVAGSGLCELRLADCSVAAGGCRDGAKAYGLAVFGLAGLTARPNSWFLVLGSWFLVAIANLKS